MKNRGFTVVELIIIVIVISILATVTMVGYGSWQRGTANKAVQSDIKQAASLMQAAYNFNNVYPTSLGDQEVSNEDKPSFKASEEVSVTLLHNATELKLYSDGSPPLETAQNAQLFLDVCKQVAFEDLAPYHSTCATLLPPIVGTGIGLTGGTHKAWLASPIQSNFTITCIPPLIIFPCTSPAYESAATAAATRIKDQFVTQGGHFPVTVPLVFSGATLPDPINEYALNDATEFCLQGVSIDFPDVKYYIHSDAPSTVMSGDCPPVS